MIATEPRLQRRYQQLVHEHLGSASRVAAGPRPAPAASSAFAATPGVGRFCHNPRITLPQLAPPRLAAAAAATPSCTRFARVVHDWSHRDLATQRGKQDRRTFDQDQKVGYEL